MFKHSSEVSSGLYNDDYANRELQGSEYSDIESYNAYDCDCLKLLALPFACFLCCVACVSWPVSLCDCGQGSRVEEEDARALFPTRGHQNFSSVFAR
jgi:hypothetical protein